jgi:hypothetical protein
MYDGHKRGEERTAPPSGFMDCIRARDVVKIALDVLHEIDNLGPLAIPGIPMRSENLLKCMNLYPPRSIGEGVDFKTEADKQAVIEEHKVYCEAVMARVEAKGENKRRLRSTLWAEQLLRSHQRQEHEVLRAFNRDEWHVRESASLDVAEREAQVREHA